MQMMRSRRCSEQVVMQVAEQRKQTVHKARPMPKYTRLEVNILFIQCNTAILYTNTQVPKNTRLEVDILFIQCNILLIFFGGCGKPEEVDDCDLPIFAHQEECQGIKMIKPHFNLLERSGCLKLVISPGSIECRGVFVNHTYLDVFHVPTIGCILMSD